MLDRVLCARCGAGLAPDFECRSCGQRYPRLASALVALPHPDEHLVHWRRQLGCILRQGEETTRALEAQAAAPDAARSTAVRLRALARSVADQVAELSGVVGRSLGDPLAATAEVGLPRGATDYLTCLFRDWAWADGRDEENSRSLAVIDRVRGGRPLGRMLVLGAGGCRLAYDLHVSGGATQTVALDVDPYLLLVAEAVVRGSAVRLTESSVHAPEIDPVSRRWTLSAPAGPLGNDVFHFLLANGTEPPFAEQSFDTIVTPWFIDQVPSDLPGLLRHLHALLVPGGQWINHGPLIYRPDALPISRWYTRQEIFDLAETIGFRVGSWEGAQQSHFVSPLSGRGLIENVLTFQATRAQISS